MLFATQKDLLFIFMEKENLSFMTRATANRRNSPPHSKFFLKILDFQDTSCKIIVLLIKEVSIEALTYQYDYSKFNCNERK